MFVDLFLVYSFIRRLATPYTEWEAYKLGIIDENGTVLRKRKDLRTIAERNAFGVFDTMILNLKKILDKVPGGKSKIASYSAALYLIKEWNHFSTDTMLVESVSDEEIIESLSFIFNGYTNYTTHMEGCQPNNAVLDDLFENTFNEDAPANSAGGGGISGIGIGPDGEPGVSVAAANRYKKRNKKGAKTLRGIIGAIQEAAPANSGAAGHIAVVSQVPGVTEPYESDSKARVHYVKNNSKKQGGILRGILGSLYVK